MRANPEPESPNTILDLLNKKPIDADTFDLAVISAGLALDVAGIETDARGGIVVDAQMRSSPDASMRYLM